MFDRLDSMAVFVKVADLGSFAAAADRLNLSAQMVGRQVQDLERRLGVRLINRSTRRQSLTSEGSAFLERCRGIIAEVEAAEAGAAAGVATPAGRLRIDAPVTFGMNCLAPALPDYLRAHPAVTIDLTLNNRNVDIIEEGFDAVVRIGELADSGLGARALSPCRFVACAAPAYLAARGDPRTIAELADHECLGFGAGADRSLWTFEGRDGQRSTVRVQGRLRTNSGQALRAAALDGFGIIVQPTALVVADLEAGRLVPVLPHLGVPPLPMHVLFVQGRQQTPKLRSFIDFVVARFGRHGSCPVDAVPGR